MAHFFALLEAIAFPWSKNRAIFTPGSSKKLISYPLTPRGTPLRVLFQPRLKVAAELGDFVKFDAKFFKKFFVNF